MSKLTMMLKVLCVAALLAAIPAAAQVSSSSIRGTITDQSGLNMPNVEVVLTNTDTGFTRTVTTDDLGQYLFQLVPVGTYKVEANGKGFKRFSQTGITIEVSRQARLDAVLEPGSVNETVTVTSDAAAVNSVESSLGRTVQNSEIVNLPLVNRDVYALLKLTPGVEFSDDTSNSFGYPEQRTMINGGADGGAGSVNYFLDGGLNSAGLRNTGAVMPNPDAVQEFRVITNGYSAEFGRFSGGVIDVVTKSGTNEIHGSAFEFLRNDQLNANDWGVLTRPTLRRNQFGGTMGGPIKANKTFVFGSYSGLRQRSQDVRSSAVVPTAAQRSGDFSAVTGAIKDPFASPAANFPANQIPVTRFDPVAVKILGQYIPGSNLPGNKFQGTEAHPKDADEGLLKLDHALSEKHQLSGSYYISKGIEVLPFLGGAGSNIPWSRETLGYTQHNLNASETWTLSPALVNQFRASWIRNYGNRVDSPDTSLSDLGSKFRIQGTPSLPQISVTGFFQLGNAIGGSPAGGNTYSLRDVMSWTKNRHTFKFGGDFSLTKLIQATTLNNYGTFTFNGGRSGNALADFLLGAPNTMNQDAPVIKTDNSWYSGLFLQDDFKIHPRLVLNLGLRYDLQTPFTDPQDRKMTWIPGAKSTVIPNAPAGLLFPGDPGVSRGIVPLATKNFGPRVGLAWDPFGNGKTAVRAAGGIFYGSISGNEWNSVTDRLPFSARQQFTNVKSLSDPYANLPGGISPYPYVYDKNNVRFILPAAIAPIAQNFVWPYNYQLNFSIQQQILSDLDVTASYVGVLSHHLPFTNDVNYPIFSSSAKTSTVDQRRPIQPGTLSSVNLLQSMLNSSYHGMHLSLNKRFSRSFMLKAFYTFSKSIEGAQLQNNTTAPGAMDAGNVALDRGRTDYDRSHNLVISSVWKLDYLQNGNPMLRAIVNGWSLSGIGSFRSGAPFTVTTGSDNNADGVNNDRPNLIGDPRLSTGRSRSDLTNAWFNVNAFGPLNFLGTGNFGRDVLVGPGFKNIDLSLFRDFKIRERMTLQFRAEMTNALNLVSLSNPNATLNSPAKGTITSAQPMRQAQLGMRLLF